LHLFAFISPSACDCVINFDFVKVGNLLFISTGDIEVAQEVKNTITTKIFSLLNMINFAGLTMRNIKFRQYTDIISIYER
jgi:hypothetical protein